MVEVTVVGSSLARLARLICPPARPPRGRWAHGYGSLRVLLRSSWLVWWRLGHHNLSRSVPNLDLYFSAGEKFVLARNSSLSELVYLRTVGQCNHSYLLVRYTPVVSDSDSAYAERYGITLAPIFHFH